MDSFYFIWKLLSGHGRVAKFYKEECEALWRTYTLDEQRFIYSSIRRNLAEGKFVHYNPINAIKDNSPKSPSVNTLTYHQYYEKFGTTEEQGGWKRVFKPEERTTVYVKGGG